MNTPDLDELRADIRNMRTETVMAELHMELGNREEALLELMRVERYAADAHRRARFIVSQLRDRDRRMVRRTT